ncbi:hypothetical protein [Streptomyces fulvorobeus]|uniref:Uncharacterized protein n=1 Tax=Streptomyces fulvorobeus TaxID=284028 RepID=A0A7J0CHV9_9ACTN|nr:hypothetical protein [Streptomyces fulvorobeus]NYE44817.1 hypothetical protein [Streptomyces fulvorobeus]GFN01385.1 hypothetical protein Sfulv_61950 [Streptomyces fulvorobeus]
MASILGLLEEREAAARVRAEELREAAALAAAALEAAEVELERRVIAREELVDALAVSAAETAVVTEDGEEKVAPSEPGPEPVAASVPGAVVPAWREGLSVSVLSPDNQRILNVLQDRPGPEPVRAKDLAEALGIDTTVPAKVEGVRSKAKRLGERGWLLLEASGMFSAGRRLVAGPAGAPSA